MHPRGRHVGPSWKLGFNHEVDKELWSPWNLITKMQELWVMDGEGGRWSCLSEKRPPAGGMGWLDLDRSKTSSQPVHQYGADKA